MAKQKLFLVPAGLKKYPRIKMKVTKGGLKQFKKTGSVSARFFRGF